MRVRIGKRVKRQIMDSRAQVTPDQELSLEILDILESFYFFKREHPESRTPLENMRTLRFVRLLHDDIILRLCKLADDDSRSWSFIQAFKKLRKRSMHTLVESEVERRIKEFRDRVRPMREHRDSYIAHHSKRDRGHLKPPELLLAIRLAVEITDMLAEKQVSYGILAIDLREDILN